jgi:hypothetical protein
VNEPIGHINQIMTTFFSDMQAKKAPPEPGQLGSVEKMQLPPFTEEDQYVGAGKLRGKVAIVTGGDSGIGRSVAILFAREGADLCVVYLNDHAEAEKTMLRIKEFECRAIKFAGDIADPDFCEEVVQRTLNAVGRFDILINNANDHCEIRGIEDLEPTRVKKVFGRTFLDFFTCPEPPCRT